MAVSLVLLAALILVVNGRPELTDEQELFDPIMKSSHCRTTVHVFYPADERELPYPLCSSRCLGGDELWIDGVVFKRLSELEAYSLMVKMTYINGSLQNCTMVAYETPEEFMARQEAQKRSMDSCSSIDKASQDEALVLSYTERIPSSPSSIPIHKRLEGFSRVGNSSYMVSPEVMNWHDAGRYCERLGAALAFPESSHEQNILEGVLKTNVWIAVNDISSEGIFVNGSNIPITYSNWKPGEPNNKNGEEDCGMLLGKDNLTWNDENCYRKIHALCEHPLEDDLNQYSCPDGYWKFKSSCYVASSDWRSYSEGEKFCFDRDAYPVFINSQEEQDFLTGNVAWYSFIGYTDIKVEGEMVSKRFGLPFFTRWAPNEPNEVEGGEDCVLIDYKKGHQWNDISCSVAIRMLCEVAAEIVK